MNPFVSQERQSAGNAPRSGPETAHPHRRTVALVALLLNLGVGLVAAGPIQTLIDGAKPGDTVLVGAGVFVDVLTIDKDLTLRGAGMGKTVIDADRDLNVLLVAKGSTATIEGITFKASDPFYPSWIGHQTWVPEGIIYADGALRMTDCELDGTRHSDGYGGILSMGPVELVGCWIHNNFGISLQSPSLVVSNCILEGNHGELAASAIHCLGPALITGCTIAHNASPSYGAIYIEHRTAATIERCKIVGNICGTGITPGVINNGVLEMSGCLVSEQWDISHAALANYGIATVSDTTFSKNTVIERYDPRTAGIENYGMMILRSVTVVSNIVEAISPDRGWGGGGGIRNYGTLTMADCLVAGNRAYYDYGLFLFPGQDILGEVISEGHNLILNTNDCVITGDVTGNIYARDPLLGPLQDNGGPTPTHALLPGSPAIAAGSPSMIGTSDQRGLPRYQGPGSRPDIGAYQTLFRPTPVIFPLASGQSGMIAGILVGLPATGYQLQQAAAVDGSSWDPALSLTTDAGGLARFSLPASGTNSFLRATGL
ncbi:MAG TPA: hypothetical protein DCM86_16635 [Verrucomicrobiales bacterium]|nr:hypothetical protein [Verrucomicrobiales bacterium]